MATLMTKPRRLAYGDIPTLTQIEVTYACNSGCIACYNPERTNLGDMQLMDSIVAKVAKSQIPHVYLIGGEPSLLGVDRLNAYIDLLSVHSSVTIVTNGLIKLEGISPKLACFGVPIHGRDAETHERFTRSKCGFEKTLESIRYYVNQGFDVRCIPVLTGYNFDQMFDIIRIASDLGMESVFVDRFEDGGLGAQNLAKFAALEPTREQFQIAVGQIIEARHTFKNFQGKIGFGTAIPYCLDERIVKEGIQSSCGVGTTFSVISPTGDFRICNQSKIAYGNILEKPIEALWRQRSLNSFRCLKWVTEPCASCPLLLQCACGCKVDTNQSDSYCIDYAVRGLSGPTQSIIDELHYPEPVVTYPTHLRSFTVNPYTKITTRYKTALLVTRYQTVELNEDAVDMLTTICSLRTMTEEELIYLFEDDIEIPGIRKFVSQLLEVDAIDEIEEV